MLPKNFGIQFLIRIFKRKAIFLNLSILLLGLNSFAQNLSDAEATAETKKTFQFLREIPKVGFAIGHQDTSAYGLGWKQGDELNETQSDVEKILNDFPGVFGFDLGGIEHNDAQNLDSVPFDLMKKLIIDAHKKGALITISWHADNPVSGGDSWDKTKAVPEILKGGKQREKFEKWIGNLADFLNDLETDGIKIPIIFRPWHEMNGSWFWWGNPNSSPSEYIQLWRETFELLIQKHQLHHLIFAYSPNTINQENEYLNNFPGDDFVDVLGIDIYDFSNSENYKRSIHTNLKWVDQIAQEKQKPYAFTETGLEGVTTKNWFEDVLYPEIKDSHITWVLFWRNANPKHHYLPYPGHLNEEDFVRFYNLEQTLFLKDLKAIKY